MVDRLAPSTRHKYQHNGHTVYEWDQTLEDVTLYVATPLGVRGKQLDVEVATRHLRVGIQGNPPYLDHDLPAAVKPSDSLWTLEGGVLTVSLAKAVAGEPWAEALAGHALGGSGQQDDRKRLMLERFQQEHPGFDFSGAEFNGEVPNPATFLGGIGGK